MLAFSLKTKATAAISALIIVLMLVMSFLTFSYFEKRFAQMIAEQQFTMVAAIAKEIDHKLQIAHETLIAEAKAAPLDLADDPDKAQAFLDKLIGVQTLFDNRLFIFSAGGRLIAETPYEDNRRGLDFSFRDYIRKTQALKRPIISDPYISSQSHRHPAIMCTAPVLDANGEIAFILAGGIDLMQDNFMGELAQMRIGKTGYLYVYNTGRTMIVHPERDRIMQRDVPLGSNYWFDRAIEGFEGTAETVNSRGVWVLATFKRIAATNWILAANLPTEEAYASIRQGKEYFFMATMIGMLLVLLVVRLIIRSLTEPLLVFTRHVATMSGKSGSARFSALNSRDEIGALARAFNQMVAELDKKTASLLKSEELYRTVVEFASDLAFWRSPEGDLLYISPNAERITGYRDSEFYADPRLLDNIVHPDDRHIWLNIGGPDAARHAALAAEFRIIAKTGDIRWVSHVRRYVYDDAGLLLGFRGSHSDITHRKQAEEKLLYLSLHDPLTGVYNRAFFEAEMRRLAASPGRLGLIVGDVDGLKLVNDTLGHDSGDQLLLAAARTISSALAGDAVFARIGGDEFVAVLREIACGDAEAAAVRIRQEIARYNAGSAKLPLSISLGVAEGVPLQEDINNLFKQADDAMYRDKLSRSPSSRSAIATALLQALEARNPDAKEAAERLKAQLAMLAKPPC